MEKLKEDINEKFGHLHLIIESHYKDYDEKNLERGDEEWNKLLDYLEANFVSKERAEELIEKTKEDMKQKTKEDMKQKTWTFTTPSLLHTNNGDRLINWEGFSKAIDEVLEDLKSQLNS